MNIKENHVTTMNGQEIESQREVTTNEQRMKQHHQKKCFFTSRNEFHLILRQFNNDGLLIFQIFLIKVPLESFRQIRFKLLGFGLQPRVHDLGIRQIDEERAKRGREKVLSRHDIEEKV